MYILALSMKPLKGVLLLCALLCALSVEKSLSDSDKIKIDPQTRLYVSSEDGRVRVFHGLALENNGFPSTLAHYSDQQIALLKMVISNVCSIRVIRELVHSLLRNT